MKAYDVKMVMFTVSLYIIFILLLFNEMYPFVYEDKANMIGLLGKTVSIMVLVDIVDYVSGKGSGDVDE